MTMTHAGGWGFSMGAGCDKGGHKKGFCWDHLGLPCKNRHSHTREGSEGGGRTKTTHANTHVRHCAPARFLCELLSLF